MNTEYKDRRTGLLVAGILEIVLGAVAWMFVALMIFGASMAAQQGAATMGSMLPSILMYSIGGVVFMVLGIGSIRARRWARNLWLVLSIGWLVCGVCGAVMAAFWLPGILETPGGQPGLPPQARVIIMAVMALFFTIFMVAIPLGFFLFYRSPHVKATCEAAQPEASWTDACPVPVLACVVWLGFMAAMQLLMPFAYGGLFPFFGFFARGAAGWGLWLLLAVLTGVAAIGLYRLQAWAWWLALGLFVGLTITTVLTYSRVDMRELYEAMGMQGAQLEQIERMGLARPGFIIGSTLGAIIPFVGLLFWARTSMGRQQRPSAATGNG